MARQPDPLVGDGLLVVDKPAGLTSHDVVSRVRRIAGTRKVGHAGTLDPMATGVLLVGVNKATRLLTYLVGCDKEYTATVRLGIATTTEDAEGEVTHAPGAVGLSDDAIADAVRTLTGRLEQVPSSVSAIKVDGRRSYERVRAGEAVALAARPVDVTVFEVLDRRDITTEVPGTASAPIPVVDLDVRVVVSAGTYVRALARDLGAALGCEGHLTALRRTRVGDFRVADATSLDRLARAREDAPPGESGLPIVSLADAAVTVMPRRDLEAIEAGKLVLGQSITPSGHGGHTAAVHDGTLIAILEDSPERGAAPRAVFAAPVGQSN